MNTSGPVVLIADNCETDLLRISSVFQAAGFAPPIQCAHDGNEAMAYLRGEGTYHDRDQFPLPSVLLLDLNILQKHRFEILTWLYAEPEAKRLPVYILDAASRPEDLEQAYDLGAHAYLIKPYSTEALTQMVNQLSVWLKTHQLAA